MLILALLLAQFVGPFTAGAPLPVIKSSGCGTTAPFTGVTTQTSVAGFTVDGDGTAGSVTVRVGTGYSNTVAAPLIFGLHETNGTPANVDTWGISQATTPFNFASTAITVMPQGKASQGFGNGWNSGLHVKGAMDQYSECPACTPPQTGRDTKWIVSMVTYMEAHFCIDQNRIFAFGFSWGGDFATSLWYGMGIGGTGTQLPHIFRAVSISAAGGDFVPDQSGLYTDYLNAKGIGTQPAYAGALHSYDDSGGDGVSLFPDLFAARNLYRVGNGCSAVSVRLANGCNQWLGCNAPTIDCPETALGHARSATYAAKTVAFFGSF